MVHAFNKALASDVTYRGFQIIRQRHRGLSEMYRNPAENMKTPGALLSSLLVKGSNANQELMMKIDKIWQNVNKICKLSKEEMRLICTEAVTMRRRTGYGVSEDEIMDSNQHGNSSMEDNENYANINWAATHTLLMLYSLINVTKDAQCQSTLISSTSDDETANSCSARNFCQITF